MPDTPMAPMTFPEPETINRVAIIGGGLIGAGWAACFLTQGIAVAIADPSPKARDALPDQVDSAWAAIQQLGLPRGARRDQLTVHETTETAVDGAEFVQECAPDRQALKIDLFKALDAVLPAGVPIGSSTSALLMTPVQAGCRHPGRCFNGHPFNPVHLVPLVEVSGGEETSPDVLDWAMRFYRSIGKHPVRLNREIQGHIAGRLSAALWREAVHLVAEGIADVEAVDAAMVHGPGLRLAAMGPHMIYHLAGGQGGMAHYLEHLGPSQQRRWQDLGTPDLTDDVQSLILRGLETETAGRDISTLEDERDKALVAILKSRQPNADKAD
jgi:carnitine 3-dehydrogenase